MTRTPFFGGHGVGRSTNAEDSVVLNLYPELIEGKDGKEVGAFYTTPGLTLKTTVGAGPIRGGGALPGSLQPSGSVSAATLYAVSGAEVYAITPGYVATLAGTLGSTTGQVSTINNGKQIAFFDGNAGYVVGPSYGITGATVETPGGSATETYAPGQILDVAGNGNISQAELEVVTTQAVNITAWSITAGGTGGTPGAVTLTGTTGTGVLFQATGTINASGVLSSLSAITVAGSYTANPTNPSAEPVTGGGLTGATLSIAMGVATVSVFWSGQYFAAPSSPIGVVEGSATFNVTSAAAGTAFGVIALPFTGPVIASYQDGFGLVNQVGTTFWWQSDLFDLSTWDALNFADAAGLPTNIVATAELHLEQWLFKTDCVEIWVNAGTPGFAFQRESGVLPEMGCAAPFSVAKAGESLIWLTSNDQGQGQVAISKGYQPARVTTFPIEREIQSYSTISDAIAFVYQQEGHLFYQITFPTGNATWVFDITSSELAGTPLWHKRAAFADGVYSRHPANAFFFFNGQPIVGDFQNGNIYAYDLDNATDNGAQRKWVRRWRANARAVDEIRRYDSLWIDMQTGIGVPNATNPQVVLSWSDDGGHTWSDPRIGAAGRTGQTTAWVKFNRLGSTARNSGLDRIFELSSTDPFAVCLVGAVLSP